MEKPDAPAYIMAKTGEVVTRLQLEERANQGAHFFRDLCTRRELEEMSQRWAVVRKLAAGHPYREIATETGVSTATIVRINQWLRHGTGGYEQMLNKLNIVREKQ